MFDIKDQYKIATSLPIIIDNYRLLHFDEFPILFSGTNKYGNKLLCSLAEEEDDIFRYFTIILDDKQNSDFLNKRKSYFDLIQSNQEVFVIDKDINNILISTFQVPLDEIPEDYLPHPDSFIPEQRQSTSLNFGFSLKGKLADLHKALVNDVNKVNQKIYDYLQESLIALNHLSLTPIIYSQPSETGSYRLNFDIEFKSNKQLNLFPTDQNKINEFINSYLNYVAYVLPDESNDFLNLSPDNSKAFQSLKQSLLDVYNGSGKTPPTSTITDRLIENINNSANKLSDITEYLKSNESFDRVELGNYNEYGNFSTIGLLTDNYKSTITSKLLVEDNLSEIADIESDEAQQDYRILVYALNRYTGKGRARLYYHDENYSIILLHIDRGEQELSNSVFTKSLDEDKVVDVKGIATKKNGIFIRLDCYL